MTNTKPFLKNFYFCLFTHLNIIIMYTCEENMLLTDKEYTYEYITQDNVCRLCLQQNATIQIQKPIRANKRSIRIFFRDIVKDCLGFIISPEQRPNKVCCKCYEQLHSFHKFRSFCIKNNEILNKVTMEANAVISNDEINASNSVITVEVPLEYHKNNSQRIKQVISQLGNITGIIENANKSKSSQNEIKHEATSDYSELSGTDLEQVLDRSEVKRVRKSKTSSLRKIKTKRSSPSYCSICCKEYENEELFQSHNSEIHSITVNGLFPCLGCSKVFKTRNACLAHEDKFCKQLENGYKCVDCDRYLPNRKLYENHKMDHQNNTVKNLPKDIFPCNKCTKVFDSKNTLKAHCLSAHPVELICEDCGRVFTRQDYLYQHRKLHSGNKMYACSECDYRCVQKSSLNIHMRRHTGERPYRCTICGHGSVSSSVLQRHLETHSDLKRFQCEVCDKQFRHKPTLLEHIASEHEHSASHPCPVCGAEYSRKRGLRRHMTAKHGGKLAVIVKDNDGPTCAENSVVIDNVLVKNLE